MTKPSKRDIQNRIESPRDDENADLTLTINHSHVDEDGDVVDEETEVIQIGGTPPWEDDERD